MRPSAPCPRCGRHNVAGLSYCPGCGAALGRGAPPKQGWRLAVGVSLLAVGLVWGAASLDNPQPERTPGAPTSDARPRTSLGLSSPPRATPPELTSAEHLAESRRALAAASEDDKAPGDEDRRAVAEARRHLEAIRPGSAEFAEARRLLREVSRHESAIERAAELRRGGEKREAEGGEDGEENFSTSRASRAPSSDRGAEARPGVKASEGTVYITRTGSKYHRAGCRYLSRSQLPVDLGDAKRYYLPCSVCNPPR